jgi:hypothetical protein
MHLKEVKTKWESFLQGEENQSYNKEAPLHDEILERLINHRIRSQSQK